MTDQERQELEADKLRGSRLSAIEPNPIGLAFSKFLRSGKEGMNDLLRHKESGFGLGNLVLGDAPEAIEDYSYGFGPFSKGKGLTTKVDPRILDVAFMPTLGAGAAIKGGAKVLAKTASEIGTNELRRNFLKGGAALGATAGAGALLPGALKVLAKGALKDVAPEVALQGAKGGIKGLTAKLIEKAELFFHPGNLDGYHGKWLNDLQVGSGMGWEDIGVWPESMEKVTTHPQFGEAMAKALQGVDEASVDPEFLSKMITWDPNIGASRSLTYEQRAAAYLDDFTFKNPVDLKDFEDYILTGKLREGANPAIMELQIVDLPKHSKLYDLTKISLGASRKVVADVERLVESIVARVRSGDKGAEKNLWDVYYGKQGEHITDIEVEAYGKAYSNLSSPEGGYAPIVKKDAKIMARQAAKQKKPKTRAERDAEFFKDDDLESKRDFLKGGAALGGAAVGVALLPKALKMMAKGVAKDVAPAVAAQAGKAGVAGLTAKLIKNAELFFHPGNFDGYSDFLDRLGAAGLSWTEKSVWPESVERFVKTPGVVEDLAKALEGIPADQVDPELLSKIMSWGAPYDYMTRGVSPSVPVRSTAASRSWDEMEEIRKSITAELKINPKMMKQYEDVIITGKLPKGANEDILHIDPREVMESSPRLGKLYKRAFEVSDELSGVYQKEVGDLVRQGLADETKMKEIINKHWDVNSDLGEREMEMISDAVGKMIDKSPKASQFYEVLRKANLLLP